MWRSSGPATRGNVYTPPRRPDRYASCAMPLGTPVARPGGRWERVVRAVSDRLAGSHSRLQGRAIGCSCSERSPAPRNASVPPRLCGVPHELMTDNGTPFVAVLRTMLSRFQRRLADLEIRHIRTQIDTPWTNGKIERFWATLQAEVLDQQTSPTSLPRTLRSWPTPAPPTTTGSTASSAGRHPASRSTARLSPTATSSMSRRSPRLRRSLPSSSRQ